MQQTLEQTITINYGETTDLGAPNTGMLSDINILPIILLITIILLAASFYLIKIRKSSRKSFRGFGAFIFLALATIALILNLPTASAIPSLTLAANQQNISITIPEGGGTASATTIVTTNTVNETGYKLTAALAQAEPGIDISLRGGDISTNTSLIANATPLSLKTTSEANLDDTVDTTEVTLTFVIDDTVASGQKQLKLAYTAVDNDPIPIASIQSFTASDCTALPTIYDGTNEDAIVTRADSRGGITRTYRIAKLADGNCWMLDNLKLGSTTNSITLTPDDTDIADDFTLPQVVTTGTPDSDNPGVYGPVPGDTGTGATNYGYLYNWSAITAGETTETMPANSGDAPYSICPVGWRLPKGGTSVDDFSNEFSMLNARMAGFTNNQDSAYLDNNNYLSYYQNWHYNGPFKGTFAGAWLYNFAAQGDFGSLQSSSATLQGDEARIMSFVANEVSVSADSGRNIGESVRCLKTPLPF